MSHAAHSTRTHDDMYQTQVDANYHQASGKEYPEPCALSLVDCGFPLEKVGCCCGPIKGNSTFAAGWEWALEDLSVGNGSLCLNGGL
jgi:hypothetical protein